MLLMYNYNLDSPMLVKLLSHFRFCTKIVDNKKLEKYHLDCFRGAEAIFSNIYNHDNHIK